MHYLCSPTSMHFLHFKYTVFYLFHCIAASFYKHLKLAICKANNLCQFFSLMSSSLNSLVIEHLQRQGFTKTASVFDEELKSEIGLQDSVSCSSAIKTFEYISV